MSDNHVRALIAYIEYRKALIGIVHPHFDCKLALFNIQLEALEKNMEEMVKQFNDMEGSIRQIESTYDGFTEKQQEEFDCVDVDGLREKQKVRAAALRYVIDMKMPNVKQNIYLEVIPSEPKIPY